ncbi:MAG: rod shape-determining protein MreC [Planctomycetes bacterium]|nr:rod shape-determining protein MreC [Planctomycetota bacterium]
MKFSPVILLVITIIIIIAPIQCLNKTELTLLTLARPFTYFYAKTPSDDTITPEIYQSLKPNDRNKFLEQQVAELRSQIVLLKNENSALASKLKTISDFREIAASGMNIKQYYNIVLADVVIKADVSAWRRSFLINRGANDGLQTGFTVVSGKYLIGKVSEVNASNSRVQLITDPAFRSQVMILPPPEEAVTPTEPAPVANPPGKKADKKTTPDQPQTGFGVLLGISFNRSLVKWVSRELKVGNNWNVFSAPDPSAITPSGLIVGTVDSFSVDGYFYTLNVKPAIDAYNLSSVLILVPKK